MSSIEAVYVYYWFLSSTLADLLQSNEQYVDVSVLLYKLLCLDKYSSKDISTVHFY